MTDRNATVVGNGPRVAAVTPIGAAGIAVIRVVGDGALAAASSIFQPLPRRPDAVSLQAGRVNIGQIVDSGRVIDDAVLTVRPLTTAGDGACGEVVEINPHGGIRVVQRVLMLLVRQGCRLTPPDEIGLLGLPADNAVQREAWESLTRAQTHRAAMWLANQQTVLANVVAECIDRLASPAKADVEWVAGRLGELLDRYESARWLVDGAGIVIAGAPNAGKSTLANRLFGQPRSIVTEQPGTTRDWIAEPAAVEGVPIVLVDTAGLRPTDDPIERASVERGLGRAAEADLVLLVVDRSEELSSTTRYAIDAVIGLPTPPRAILVANKSDLPDRLGHAAELDHAWIDRVEISVDTGEGCDRLSRAIAGALGLAEWPDRLPAFWTPRQEALARESVRLLPDRWVLASNVLREVLEKP